MQGQVALLSVKLAGALKACELLCCVALNAEAQRMQETAALSAHNTELFNQVLAMHQQGTWVCFTLVIPYRDAWVPHCAYRLLPSNPRPCPVYRRHKGARECTHYATRVILPIAQLSAGVVCSP